MTLNSFFKSLLLIGLLTAGSVLCAEKPNIVIFLADDLGYGSLNAYGAEKRFVKTPHLDKLAADGMLFRNGLTTASVCTPTRYTMLTGEYSWRTALKKGVVNNNDPLIVSPETETVASFLQKRGYRTAAIGKWHLGYKTEEFEDLLGKIEPGPLQLGFDYHFGVPNNLDDLHKIYIENDRIYNLRSNKIEAYGKSSYGGEYVGYDAEQRVTAEVMDVTMDKAIEWISRNTEQPFFLYFGSVAVHNPIVPSRYMKGKSGVGPYGDFIQDVDRVAGRLIEALEERGLAENTLFLFTSDNGGDIPTRDDRVQLIAIDRGFNYNGKHRGDKHTIYEGGLKVPFIVKWPAMIAKGQVSDTMVTTADVFGTIAEIVDGELPDPREAAPDSYSFLNVLKDPKAKSTRKYLINRDVNGIHCLRSDKWKYIEGIPEAGTNEEHKKKMEPELYKLDIDPEETRNVIDRHPEMAEKAQQYLEELRERTFSRQ